MSAMSHGNAGFGVSCHQSIYTGLMWLTVMWTAPLRSDSIQRYLIMTKHINPPCTSYVIEYVYLVQVLGPGGCTGVAMSPARDMGPRLAHWVLPIKGKGSSEFLSYSWIPFTASLCGAVPAAFIVRGINMIIAEGVVPTWWSRQPFAFALYPYHPTWILLVII